MHSSGITGSYFNFLRNLHPVSHNGCKTRSILMRTKILQFIYSKLSQVKLTKSDVWSFTLFKEFGKRICLEDDPVRKMTWNGERFLFVCQLQVKTKQQTSPPCNASSGISLLSLGFSQMQIQGTGEISPEKFLTPHRGAAWEGNLDQVGVRGGGGSQVQQDNHHTHPLCRIPMAEYFLQGAFGSKDNTIVNRCCWLCLAFR